MKNDQGRNPESEIQNLKSTSRSPLSVEVALWGVVAGVALVLRLVNLDAAPLSGAEAREALLAWRAVTGQGLPGADYSPFLLTMNALLFTLFGASDALARLWPALFGCSLALVPWLFRRRIGRLGALAAGFYLALSPTALFASRQVDGAVVAVLGGMAFLGGWVRFHDTDRRAWLTLSAAALAVAVTSSPSVYGLLVSLGLSWLVLAGVWPDGEIRRMGERLRPHLGHLLLVFLLVGLALSTGLGWNPTGFGAIGGGVLAWFARFGRGSISVGSPLMHLVLYEPLGLLFGLGGLADAIRRKDRRGVLLGLWAGIGALLLTLMPGRSPLDTLWPVLPLALLTGAATESIVQHLREQGEWLTEGLYIPVVVILWIHLYLMLARYAVSGSPADLALALLALALQILLAMIFALVMRAHGALRALGVGTGVVLLGFTVAIGWGTAHVRPADPRELIAGEPTDAGVRDLVQTLRDLSWEETGLPTTLPLTLEAAPDSVLAWYLRDFGAARSLDLEEDVGSVVVTTRRDSNPPGLADVSDGVEFEGQDFVLRRRWSPVEIGCTWEWPPRCNAAVKWLLFRDTPVEPEIVQWAVVWRQQEPVSE